MRQGRKKRSAKAVALLDRFKHVPKVDPRRFREDVDRCFRENPVAPSKRA